MRHANLALGLVTLSGACGPSTRPYPDEVSLGTFCVTVEGEEVCAEEGVEATVEPVGGGRRVSATTEVTLPGASLGYERASLSFSAEVPDGAELPYADEGGVALAPVLVTCTRVIAHLDHCDFNIRDDLACELPVDDSLRRFSYTVDRLTDDEVQVRFFGVLREDRPDCCVHTCDRPNLPDPEAEPGGPYTIAGVARLPVR